MIYIIDEKNIRQANYGWNEERFESHVEDVKPIHSIEKLQEISTEELFRKDNIILFHDSFFDVSKNKKTKESDSLKHRLKNRSEDSKIVFFSGSYAGRSIENENYAEMHVSWVYKNLNFFIDKKKQGDLDLRYLAFGKNYLYEQIDEIRTNIWRYLYTKDTLKEKFELPLKVVDDIVNIVSLTGVETDIEDIETEPKTASYFKYRINDIIKRGLHE